MDNKSTYNYSNFTFFINKNNKFGWEINKKITILCSNMVFSNHIYCAKEDKNIISVYCTEKYTIEDFNEGNVHTIISDKNIEEWTGDIFIINKDENKILQHYYPKFNKYIYRPAKYISLKDDEYIKIYNFAELSVIDENAKSFTFIYAHFKNQELSHFIKTIPIKVIRTNKKSLRFNFINKTRMRLLEDIQTRNAEYTYKKLINNYNFNYESDILLGLTPLKSLTSPSFFNFNNITNKGNLLDIEVYNSFYKLICELPINNFKNKIKIEI
ncbi:MAG: hypothetical protein CMF62_00625 [Magnetococcales bacterium]|nr:hypothetical protein [Magnetococcales bacterium]|tara:strand:+ start:18287 stop:19096 length:810 start_codon:yes stop_codon:yes gene_type:complete